jgi:sialic acid synthase SpsE
MYLIAEIGTNHNGDPDTAYRLVDAAVETGVNAVKMNHWDADLLVSKHSRWYQRCKNLTLPYETLKKCSLICNKAGIDFIIAPWSAHLVEESVEIADKIKIASGELTNDGLLQAVNLSGASSILSTGMATFEEINHAVDILQPDVLMHCVSLYPTKLEETNLTRIRKLYNEFQDWCRVGYSSHTGSILDIIAAYCLGAKTIEFHFNVRNNQCLDDEISFESIEVLPLVKKLKSIDTMLEDTTGVDLRMKDKLRRNPETGLRR